VGWGEKGEWALNIPFIVSARLLPSKQLSSKREILRTEEEVVGLVERK